MLWTPLSGGTFVSIFGTAGRSRGNRSGRRRKKARLQIETLETRTTPASLSGFVFGDTDHSGDFSTGDALLGDAIISLKDANGNLLAQQTTGNDGAFSFTNLPAGNYQIIENYQESVHGYMDGQDFPGLINGVPDTNAIVDPIGGDRVFNIILNADDVGTNYRFGECPCLPPATTSIHGFVFFDFNCNGHKSPGEPGLPGVRIKLTDLNGNPVTDVNGNVVGIATTAADGSYQFVDLPVGTYRVTELPPQPLFNGGPTINGITTAGNVNGVTVGIACGDVITNISLTAGQESYDNNFGECTPNVGSISLSGKVYCDANKNCVLDAGDEPIGGAGVHLYRIDQPGGPVLISSMSTNDKGAYLFQVVTPGTYQVTLDNVTGAVKECAQPGTVNGVPTGTAPAVDVLTNIPLTSGDTGANYNFALICNTIPPNSKQGLLANLPGSPVISPFATNPSFANIFTGADHTHLMATGADAGFAPVVRVFDFTTGKTLFNITAYNPAFLGGVRVAVGDVNCDGTPDVITAPGAGGGPNVRVFDGKTGALMRSFMAYNPAFTGGVFVAAGDVNGDGLADVITGAGPGGGPMVKVFDGATGANTAAFFAYNPAFTGGVRVAGGDFNADGLVDLVTGPGAGGGPEVRIFNSANIGKSALTKIADFFAFAPTYTGGIYVAANSTGQGDFTGDGLTDLVVGTGTGVGQVKVIDGTSFTTYATFDAYAPAQAAGGVRVAVFDLNGDGKADIVAGAGGGAGALVRVLKVTTGQDLEFFQAFNPAFLGGVWVGVA